MELEIATVGGYEEVGRNMTAVRAGDDVVVFDAGLDLSAVLANDLDAERAGRRALIEAAAIPDDRVLSSLGGGVRAVVCSHGHLDHVGAVPKLAGRYDAPVYGTPFTLEVVRGLLAGEETGASELDLVSLEAGEQTRVGDGLGLEFVHATHSTVGAVNPVLHTPAGAVVYGLDKRLDHDPVLEDPFDAERFAELGEQGVRCYVEDCTNATDGGRTPGERVARARVRDAVESLADAGGAVVATTFASHVERVHGLVECAREAGREPLLLGRSMGEYATAAKHYGYLADDVEAFGHGRTIERALRRVTNEGREKFLPVVTGHQGEPNAVLSRISRGETPLTLAEGDAVLFAAGVVPDPANEASRYRLESRLRARGVRLFDDLHVSGHLRQEGHYEMLRTLRPDHVVPAHQTLRGVAPYVDLAESEGYALGEDLHVSRNGNTITLAE